jgi:hypothetical protein
MGFEDGFRMLVKLLVDVIVKLLLGLISVSHRKVFLFLLLLILLIVF